jgi:hypothetical protein
MNPSLQYAQGIPGTAEGRSEGLLDGRGIAVAVDAAGLLAPSSSWTATDRDGMRSWLEKYSRWLSTNENARKEREASNNHGTWFDVQAATVALCLGNKSDAVNILREAQRRRVDAQIENDGSQPLEMKRADGFHYSFYNLQALAELATLGSHVGVDLWNGNKDGKKGIRGAVVFLLPYVDVPGKEWDLQKIKEKKPGDFLPILQETSVVYGDPQIEAVLAKYPDAADMTTRLLFVK